MKSQKNTVAVFNTIQLAMIPNTVIWCIPKNKGVKIKDLRAKDCLSCAHHFENGGICSPLPQ